MIRLALVSFYPTDVRYIRGGIRMVAYNLVQALAAKGDMELRVIHCHADVQQDETIEQGNLTVCHRTLPRRGLIPNLTLAIGRVRQELHGYQPDLVHAHAAHFAYASVREGLPTVYTIHGALPRERQIYSERLYDRMRYGLLDYYERRTLDRVDALVAISPYIQRAYGHHKTISWERIDNPIPPDFFSLRGFGNPCRLLYAGSITEIKDILTLLRAVERIHQVLPAVELILAGRSTSDSYAHQVKEFVREHGMSDIVRFVGLLDRQEMLEAYEQSALVVLPSIQENAPMTIIEAMAAHKPVVATRVGGIPDLVDHGKTGFLVEAGDDADMARRIVQLLQDSELRRTMGEHAYQLAQRRFAAENVAQAYTDLYHRVLEQRSVLRG